MTVDTVDAWEQLVQQERQFTRAPLSVLMIALNYLELQVLSKVFVSEIQSC